MSAPRQPRVMWSRQEDQSLIAHVSHGMPPGEIAVLMGRTTDAVKSRIVTLRHRGQLKLPQDAPITDTARHPPTAPAGLRLAAQSPAFRTCLKCGKTFGSRHAGHRLCGSCSSSSSSSLTMFTAPASIR